MTVGVSLPRGSGSVAHEDPGPSPEKGAEDAAFDSIYPL